MLKNLSNFAAILNKGITLITDNSANVIDILGKRE